MKPVNSAYLAGSSLNPISCSNSRQFNPGWNMLEWIGLVRVWVVFGSAIFGITLSLVVSIFCGWISGCPPSSNVIFRSHCFLNQIIIKLGWLEPNHFRFGWISSRSLFTRLIFRWYDSINLDIIRFELTSSRIIYYIRLSRVKSPLIVDWSLSSWGYIHIYHSQNWVIIGLYADCDFLLFSSCVFH